MLIKAAIQTGHFSDIRMATPTTPVKELPKEMLIGDRLKG